MFIVRVVLARNILFFGQGKVEVFYRDEDSFKNSINPIKSLINDLNCFRKNLDISDLDSSQKLFAGNI